MSFRFDLSSRLHCSELLTVLGAREQCVQRGVLERLFWLAYRKLATRVTLTTSVFLRQWCQSDQENQETLRGEVEVLRLEVVLILTFSAGQPCPSDAHSQDPTKPTDWSPPKATALPFLLPSFPPLPPLWALFLFTHSSSLCSFRGKNWVVVIELEPEPMKV